MTVTTAVDPVTFEIIRHRLHGINEEAATAIGRISGSPVANEAYDFNTALITSGGEVVVIGKYVMAHAAAMDCVVQWVMANYEDNPGIGPGDMFMTNDPYVGAMHQPDVVLVAPIHDGDRRIFWCGSVVHQTDVGGPIAGSVTTGATSIYGEAIPLAPVKMVENGRLRKDIEREYLIRSRMPGLNALDVRGQIAANNIQHERILQLCGRYGTETVLAVVDQMVDTTAERFRRRLRDLPDGRWRHETFIEHDGVQDSVYAIRLTMTKQGDRLELDFTDSDEQAPSLINCSVGTLRGYALSAVLTLLNQDIPWVPAALWRSIDMRTRKGTIVDAEWPAGVSMGNTASGHNLRTCINVCIAMMLDGSDVHAPRAMASCVGSYAGQNISGFWERGERFGMMMMEPIVGGGGALSAADGVDTAGQINAPSSAIGNVEVNEYNCPMLYLWRRELSDSGGAGRQRGGVGGQHAYVPHHVRDEMQSTVFGHGMEQPTSSGVSGGEPGGPNGYVVVRGGRSLVARSLTDLGGRHEYLPPKSTTTISPEDVYVHWYAGGGGFGDPLERDPAAVLRDVRAGLVTVDGARDDYKVVVDASGGEPAVDRSATERLRAATRRDRIGREPVPIGSAPADGGRRLTSYLAVHDGSVACRACGEVLGPVADGAMTHLVTDEVAVTDRWPRTRAYEGAERFVLRRRYCPHCATQVHAEVALRGTPLVEAIDVGAGAAPAPGG